jgi:hypothetical protein
MGKPIDIEDVHVSLIIVGNLSTFDDVGKSIDIVMAEVRNLERQGYELIGPVQATMTNVYVYHLATLRLKDRR